MTPTFADRGPNDLSMRSNGFLHGISELETGLPGAVALRASYELDQFNPRLFTTLGLRYPERLHSVVPKRQAEYLAGRSLARMCLQRFNATVSEIPSQPGGAPQWPEGFAGSLSHSKGQCICLLVNHPDCLTGVDVEGVVSARALHAVQRMCLTAGERDTLLAQNVLPVAEFATLIFSAKESLYKMLFPIVQRYFGFPCAELVGLPEAGRLTLSLTEKLHPSLRAGQQFDLRFQVTLPHVITWGAAWRDGEKVAQAAPPL